MKDRTNREKPDLVQTIESLGLMQRWLETLYREEYPQSPLWFAIKAEGPIEQIRDLLDDVEWLMEDMLPQHLREQATPHEAASLESVAQQHAA